MSTSLSTVANERSSYFVTVTLLDEDAVTIPTTHITTISWTLTNSYGDVINNLSQVVPSTITNPFTIILSGNDLQIEGGADEIRHLTVEATYDSDLGNDLNFTDYATFTVKNLVAIDGTMPSFSTSPSSSASPSAAP